MLMPNSMVVQFMGELLNDYYDQAGWTDGCIMYLVNSIFAGVHVKRWAFDGVWSAFIVWALNRSLE